MKHSKITALALTGAMLAGTFATATPVLAGSGIETNDVSCTANGATYTMVIPTSITVANSGYNTLGDGITIKNLANADKVKSIEVTASSENSWVLRKDKDNTIGYDLAESEASTTFLSKLVFTDTKAMKETGETKTVGINVDDYSEAEAGDYSDTITWTATAVEYTGITFAEGNDTHKFTSLSATWTPTYTVETANTAEDKKNLKWSSSDENVATVNESTGEITPVANGTSDITVSTSDGKYSAICQVTVSISQAGGLISMNPTSDSSVTVNKKTDIGEYIETNPEDFEGERSDFTYELKEGKDIAEVTEDGYITFKSTGKATVIVTYKADASVTVTLVLVASEPT